MEAGAPSSDRLLLDFDDLPPGEVAADVELAPAQHGAEVRVRTVGAGRVSLEPHPRGGQALRLPPYDDTATARAVVTVAAPPALLQPDGHDFELTASFNLDAESEGGLDNGNNLVQRGLWGEAAQYKIQVDDGIVSCRVAGDRGEVIVKGAEAVVPGAWFTARCVRSQDRLTLHLDGPDGSSAASEVEGPTGDLSFRDDTPLVIGGKTTPEGIPVEGASDQFNGAVDDVELVVHR
ncbi:LamG domain-containing protein [Nocardioides aequoreus]|uniref:LamG domain-containing protein n=1 Tax=Nocardioides aequoreus TaxID=397278 RepID=UPI00146FD55D|nr:LamG domain-containing protein [Nocardioides aequoreus]